MRRRPTVFSIPTSFLRWHGGAPHREAARFAPELTVAVHYGTDRAASGEAFQSAGLVVTSYATAVRDASLLADVSWRLICLDEAQFIKNPHAKTTKALKVLPADLRLCLTGTENTGGAGRAAILPWRANASKQAASSTPCSKK